jgi:hypothetical protein
MNIKKTAAALTVTATALAGATLLAPAAHASGGGTAVTASGHCSGSATWKLKAKQDNGKLQVEFEVDSNVNGQTWAVRIRDNGDLVFSGNRVTRAPSGSFTVARRIANKAGSDTITARATHAGQTCVGSVTL